jgi:phosphatidylglycerol:prolipoprotein diacylglycerol transferase
MLTFLGAVGWPVLDRFRFGDGFAISPHGIFIAIGFMLGAWLLGRIGPERGISADEVNSIAFWSLIGALIGSRLFYVIGHFSEFDNLGQMLAIWRGGISLLGGIAGGVLINVPRVRRRGFRFFQVADAVAPALAFGIAIGRIGDLLIGDHLGKPTSWFLAWTYRGGTLAPPFRCVAESCQAALQGGHLEVVTRAGVRLLDAQGNVIAQGTGLHQTALYDMVIAWGLFAFLWFFMKKPRREGVLTLCFGLIYGCARILEDSVRIDKRFWFFTGSQWTAFTVALISGSILIWWAFHPRRDPPEAASVEGDAGDSGSSPEDPEPART